MNTEACYTLYVWRYHDVSVGHTAPQEDQHLLVMSTGSAGWRHLSTSNLKTTKVLRQGGPQWLPLLANAAGEVLVAT